MQIKMHRKLFLTLALTNHTSAHQLIDMAFINDQTAGQLAEALNGNDRAQEWLQRQGKQELVMLHDAIRFDDDGAMEWLHEYGHDELGLFVTACDGDPYAVQALYDGNKSRLAAVAGAVIGDERSMKYLEKNNMKQWINLVKAIQKCQQEE